MVKRNHKRSILALSEKGIDVSKYVSSRDIELVRRNVGDQLYPAKIEVLSLLSEKIREEFGNVT